MVAVVGKARLVEIVPLALVVRHRQPLVEVVLALRLEQLWLVPDKGLERPSFQMLAATEKLCALLARAR